MKRGDGLLDRLNTTVGLLQRAMNIHPAILAFGAMTMACSAFAASAQPVNDYPTRPIRLVAADHLIFCRVKAPELLTPSQIQEAIDRLAARAVYRHPAG